MSSEGSSSVASSATNATNAASQPPPTGAVPSGAPAGAATAGATTGTAAIPNAAGSAIASAANPNPSGQAPAALTGASSATSGAGGPGPVPSQAQPGQLPGQSALGQVPHRPTAQTTPPATTTTVKTDIVGARTFERPSYDKYLTRAGLSASHDSSLKFEERPENVRTEAAGYIFNYLRNGIISDEEKKKVVKFFALNSERGAEILCEYCHNDDQLNLILEMLKTEPRFYYHKQERSEKSRQRSIFKYSHQIIKANPDITEIRNHMAKRNMAIAGAFELARRNNQKTEIDYNPAEELEKDVLEKMLEKYSTSTPGKVQKLDENEIKLLCNHPDKGKFLAKLCTSNEPVFYELMDSLKKMTEKPPEDPNLKPHEQPKAPLTQDEFQALRNSMKPHLSNSSLFDAASKPQNKDVANLLHSLCSQDSDDAKEEIRSLSQQALSVMQRDYTLSELNAFVALYKKDEGVFEELMERFPNETVKKKIREHVRLFTQEKIIAEQLDSSKIPDPPKTAAKTPISPTSSSASASPGSSAPAAPAPVVTKEQFIVATIDKIKKNIYQNNVDNLSSEELSYVKNAIKLIISECRLDENELIQLQTAYKEIERQEEILFKQELKKADPYVQHHYKEMQELVGPTLIPIEQRFALLSFLNAYKKGKPDDAEAVVMTHFRKFLKDAAKIKKENFSNLQKGKPTENLPDFWEQLCNEDDELARNQAFQPLNSFFNHFLPVKLGIAKKSNDLNPKPGMGITPNCYPPGSEESQLLKKKYAQSLDDPNTFYKVDLNHNVEPGKKGSNKTFATLDCTFATKNHKGVFVERKSPRISIDITSLGRLPNENEINQDEINLILHMSLTNAEEINNVTQIPEEFQELYKSISNVEKLSRYNKLVSFSKELRTKLDNSYPLGLSPPKSTNVFFNFFTRLKVDFSRLRSPENLEPVFAREELAAVSAIAPPEKVDQKAKAPGLINVPSNDNSHLYCLALALKSEEQTKDQIENKNKWNKVPDTLATDKDYDSWDDLLDLDPAANDLRDTAVTWLGENKDKPEVRKNLLEAALKEDTIKDKEFTNNKIKKNKTEIAILDQQIIAKKCEQDPDKKDPTKSKSAAYSKNITDQQTLTSTISKQTENYNKFEQESETLTSKLLSLSDDVRKARDNKDASKLLELDKTIKEASVALEKCNSEKEKAFKDLKENKAKLEVLETSLKELTEEIDKLLIDDNAKQDIQIFTRRKLELEKEITEETENLQMDEYLTICKKESRCDFDLEMLALSSHYNVKINVVDNKGVTKEFPQPAAAAPAAPPATPPTTPTPKITIVKISDKLFNLKSKNATVKEEEYEGEESDKATPLQPRMTLTRKPRDLNDKLPTGSRRTKKPETTVNAADKAAADKAAADKAAADKAAADKAAADKAAADKATADKAAADKAAADRATADKATADKAAADKAAADKAVSEDAERTAAARAAAEKAAGDRAAAEKATADKAAADKAAADKAAFLATLQVKNEEQSTSGFTKLASSLPISLKPHVNDLLIGTQKTEGSFTGRHLRQAAINWLAQKQNDPELRSKLLEAAIDHKNKMTPKPVGATKIVEVPTNKGEENKLINEYLIWSAQQNNPDPEPIHIMALSTALKGQINQDFTFEDTVTRMSSTHTRQTTASPPKPTTASPPPLSKTTVPPLLTPSPKSPERNPLPPKSPASTHSPKNQQASTQTEHIPLSSQKEPEKTSADAHSASRAHVDSNTATTATDRTNMTRSEEVIISNQHEKSDVQKAAHPYIVNKEEQADSFLTIIARTEQSVLKSKLPEISQPITGKHLRQIAIDYLFEKRMHPLLKAEMLREAHTQLSKFTREQLQTAFGGELPADLSKIDQQTEEKLIKFYLLMCAQSVNATPLLLTALNYALGGTNFKLPQQPSSPAQSSQPLGSATQSSLYPPNKAATPPSSSSLQAAGPNTSNSPLPVKPQTEPQNVKAQAAPSGPSHTTATSSLQNQPSVPVEQAKHIDVPHNGSCLLSAFIMGAMSTPENAAQFQNRPEFLNVPSTVDGRNQCDRLVQEGQGQQAEEQLILATNTLRSEIVEWFQDPQNSAANPNLQAEIDGAAKDAQAGNPAQFEDAMIRIYDDAITKAQEEIDREKYGKSYDNYKLFTKNKQAIDSAIAQLNSFNTDLISQETLSQINQELAGQVAPWNQQLQILKTKAEAAIEDDPNKKAKLEDLNGKLEISKSHKAIYAKDRFYDLSKNEPRFFCDLPHIRALSAKYEIPVTVLSTNRKDPVATINHEFKRPPITIVHVSGIHYELVDTTQMAPELAVQPQNQTQNVSSKTAGPNFSASPSLSSAASLPSTLSTEPKSVQLPKSPLLATPSLKTSIKEPPIEQLTPEQLVRKTSETEDEILKLEREITTLNNILFLGITSTSRDQINSAIRKYNEQLLNLNNYMVAIVNRREALGSKLLDLRDKKNKAQEQITLLSLALGKKI